MSAIKFLCPSKNLNIEKTWDSVVFALIFFWIWLCSRFFLCSRLFLCFFEKSRQKWQSPNFFLSVFKNLCSKKHKYFWKHLEKSWDSVIFALIFQKNIEKVWNIEKIWNIAKFRKNQGKNDRVRGFFYVQVFRWTGLNCISVRVNQVIKGIEIYQWP